MPRKNNNDLSNENELTMEDLKSLIQGIEKKIVESETSVKNYFDGKFGSISQRLTELESISVNAITVANEAIMKANAATSKTDDALKSISFANKRIDELEEKCRELEKSLTLFEKTNATIITKLKVVSERLEDQVNRSCRKTLILRGVKERKEENWNDTKKVVTEVIDKLCDVSLDPDEHIERAHRGHKLTHKSKKTARDIHVCFYDWNDTQKVLQGFQKHGIGNNQNIFIEQRFGPNTSWRRNQAKLARKSLKEKKEIISGYISYPAKLMVKKSKEGKYSLFKDFSNMEVEDEL